MRSVYHSGPLMAQPGSRHVRTAGVAAAVVATILAFVFRWARRSGLHPLRVQGDSMLPTFPSGALVAAAPVLDDPREGTIVVLRRPDGSEHVKRVVQRGPNGAAGIQGRRLNSDEYWVEGDFAAHSIDSRHYGPITRRDIVGVVRVCYWPPRAWRVMRAQ